MNALIFVLSVHWFAIDGDEARASVPRYFTSQQRCTKASEKAAELLARRGNTDITSACLEVRVPDAYRQKVADSEVNEQLPARGEAL